MSALRFKILKDGEEVDADLFTWARWFENIESRTVDRHRFQFGELDILVSTVFLGLDHGFHGNPAYYETLVQGGEFKDEIERYGSREEAIIGHQRWVQKVEKTYASLLKPER